jgi:hypothetical protein
MAKRSDKKRAQTIDGETGLPEPTPRRVDLSSLRDVLVEMAAVYREVDRGSIESHDGSRRVFMLRQIADVIVNAELERRICELEARQADGAFVSRPLLPAQRIN